MHYTYESLAHVQTAILCDWSCCKNEASGRTARVSNVTTVEHLTLLGIVQLMFLNNLISQDFSYIDNVQSAVTAPVIHTVRLCLWLHVLILEVGGQTRLQSS